MPIGDSESRLPYMFAMGIAYISIVTGLIVEAFLLLFFICNTV